MTIKTPKNQSPLSNVQDSYFEKIVPEKSKIDDIQNPHDKKGCGKKLWYGKSGFFVCGENNDLCSECEEKDGVK